MIWSRRRGRASGTRSTASWIGIRTVSTVSSVERLNLGDEIRPDEILSEHPDLAREILDHLECFLDLAQGADANVPSIGILGDYTLRREIGRGGMGVVYEAWENSMERRVALKVLPAGVAADARAGARFLREAQTAGKLSHPNVVPVYFTESFTSASSRKRSRTSPTASSTRTRRASCTGTSSRRT